MIFDDATIRQIHAASPVRSSWVSANAGSGKTRVLTNRVARMLFHGVPPGRILCLTYTKAAASEMQIRLFETLGAWSMASDDELGDALARLGEQGPLSAQDLRRARQMFATAIETPGGLKIQTIHAFCSSVLRRFPLEAGVSPNFHELDDRTTKQLRKDCLDKVAVEEPEIFDVLMRHGPSDLEMLAQAIVGNSTSFGTASPEKIWSGFGLMPGFSEASLLSDYRFCEDDGAAITAFCAADFQGKTDRKNTEKLQPLAGRPLELDDVPVLENVFLTATGANPFTAKIGKIPTKPMQPVLGAHLDALENLMIRVEENRPHRLALKGAQRTLDLTNFAQVFLAEYEARKTATGSLDFDDLISKALGLLSNSEAASWVMYRLDGGIDHILVDEAQDTSPKQWEIIKCLAGEFTAGQGAREEMVRTIFVVGDRKQSIYSFQGAAPQAFEEMRDAYGRQLKQVGSDLQQIELSHSFRSSPAILNFVDVALRPFADQGIGDHLDHIAFKSEMPGRVEVWPLFEDTGEKPDSPPFSDPVDLVTPDHPSRRLAAEIAHEIKGILDRGERIMDRDGPRPIQPGDFLILVQKRSGILFREILRSLKAENLDVSGSDRLLLLEELAVKDLLSLLSFLALPQNDLALAEAMRSPILGFSEADLFEIANPRKDGHTLWSALCSTRSKDDPGRRILHDLMKMTDVLAPFELLDRILTRHGGRRNLIGRLGHECEDAIDALLSLAIAYERQETPSLVGFLTWVGSDEVKVSRQMDGEGNMIRVMTSHGAKGLESPIVILPDTAQTNSNSGSGILVDENGPIWRPLAADMDERSTRAKDEAARLAEEEKKRLLYVAMTRAESWLIICGAGNPGEASWHTIASDAIGSIPHDHLVSSIGVRRRVSYGDWPQAGHPAKSGTEHVVEIPDWAYDDAKNPPRPKQVLSPSELEGSKALASSDGNETDQAMDRGTAIHRLLEILPETEPARWQSVARANFGERPDFDDIFDEVRIVLETPELSFLFADQTFAEVPVSATIDVLGGSRISGIIDRLVVSKDRVLLVDYKTNISIPKNPEETPDGLLRQLGAYQSAVQQIFPDLSVDVAILWTQDASLMMYAHDIVREALERTTVS